jgi:hypothetical protein
MVALDELEADLSPFQLVSWNLLCKRPRRYARAQKESAMMKASVAFCITLRKFRRSAQRFPPLRCGAGWQPAAGW